MVNQNKIFSFKIKRRAKKKKKKKKKKNVFPSDVERTVGVVMMVIRTTIIIIIIIIIIIVVVVVALYFINIHITKTRPFKYIENLTAKNWKFSDKKKHIFRISAQNIDCGYSLEPPWQGGSNEYPQSMFLSRNKKNNAYPCKPQFYYIKVGLKGSNLYRHVFVMIIIISNSRIVILPLFLFQEIIYISF